MLSTSNRALYKIPSISQNLSLDVTRVDVIFYTSVKKIYICPLCRPKPAFRETIFVAEEQVSCKLNYSRCIVYSRCIFLSIFFKQVKSAEASVLCQLCDMEGICLSNLLVFYFSSLHQWRRALFSLC